jgi:hypothetical protein
MKFQRYCKQDNRKIPLEENAGKVDIDQRLAKHKRAYQTVHSERF